MNFQHFEQENIISAFVKNIIVFEGNDPTAKTILPFFADGLPGLIYHTTEQGLRIHPHDKFMPELFLYGQTIKPVEIEIKGRYQLIVLQLFPFTIKGLFGIEPSAIVDNCHYLSDVNEIKTADIINRLNRCSGLPEKIDILNNLVGMLIKHKKSKFDPAILTAIDMIIRAKGQINLSELHKAVYLNERTFQRRFLSETGLSPKQFAMIIQFQQSLSQLTLKDYRLLTDIVFENGYADQSHFTRVFKSFTGKTPSEFVRLQL